MKTSDFDYNLPQELIAQTPLTPRDSSKLLVYDKSKDMVYHNHFYDITKYLKAGDLLVLNETKVIPARLYGKKQGKEKEYEVLLLKRINLNVWEVIIRGLKSVKIGDSIYFDTDFYVTLKEKLQDGVCVAEFFYEGIFENLLDKYGNMPLPPYITQKLEEKEKYQTVYAKQEGSAAAPTAGLHFTPKLLNKAEQMGVEIVKITLHIGLGTFRPMKEEHIADHIMHSEYYEVSKESADKINMAKAQNRRVICVGTTSVRTLESCANSKGVVQAGSNNTDIFIYPGYKFKVTDGIITNFHLPKSTLIMLICAFLGKDKTLEIYKKAVEEKYRFFSFGDAMFLF